MSFGTNIRDPGRLEIRPVGDILDRIRHGEWRQEIERLRSLPEKAQDAAKTALPYFTPSGRFSYRSDDKLVQYSRIVVVDLDDLPSRRITRIIQTAVADHHCFAAFRSPRGRGVKLLFRVPRRFGPFHKQIFLQVARHVRRRYGVKPDKGGDVSRPCFVSWDSGAWIFGGAKELPIAEPGTCEEESRGSKPAAPSPTEPDFPVEFSEAELDKGPFEWSMLGWNCAPSRWKSDDHSFTNDALLRLARRASTEIWKLPKRRSERESVRLLAVAFRGWCRKARYRKVRWAYTVYWKKLLRLFRKQMRSRHPEKNASKWTRWRDHPEFPRSGPREQILFAIRMHCKREETNRFYLSMRDAGRVAGTSQVSARKHLAKLREEGCINYDPSTQKFRGGPRNAFKYILSEGDH